ADLLRCVEEGRCANGVASIRGRRSCVWLATNEISNHGMATPGRNVAANNRCSFMDIQLRDTSQNDLDFLYQLHRNAMRSYVVQTWGQWDEARQFNYFSEQFDPSTYQIIVADKKDIGMISIIRRETEIFLRHIEVDPAYQGQGIGTQLILTVADEAAARRL